MSRIAASVVLLFALGMLGCRNVRPSELTGTWAIKASSRSLLPAKTRGAAATLVLNADGTFVASEVPEDLPPIPQYKSTQDSIRLDAGDGRWTLVSEEHEQQVWLSFQKMKGNSQVPYGMPLDVSRGLRSITLFYFLGDPDEGRRISFEKR